MKKYLSSCLLLICQILYSQYYIGFNDGFKNGYCFDDFGCIAPIPPVPLMLGIGESYDNYNQGYNRGFSVGQSKKNLDNSGTNQTNLSPYGNPTKFGEMNLYHPNNEFLLNIYQKMDQRYSEQGTTNEINEIENNYFLEFNSAEAKKLRYEAFIRLKTKCDSYKLKPNELKNGWFKVVQYDGDIDDNNPKIIGETKEKWVFVENNIVIMVTNNPENFENGDSTSYYFPKEKIENLKNDLIQRGDITSQIVISESNLIFAGVAKIIKDLYVNQNGKITVVGRNTPYQEKIISLIFVDYMEKFNNAQQCIKLNKIKNQNQKKFNITNGWNIVCANNGRDFCETREVFVKNGKIIKYRSRNRGDINIESGGKILNGKSNITYTIYDLKSNYNHQLSFNILF
jgi:hypothetical protein